MTKKILLLSDMHVGAVTSVMPKEIHYRNNGVDEYYHENKLQAGIREIWEKMKKDVKSVDAVFNLGDSCEGTNYHGKGYGNWTNNKKLQADAAYELLRKIKTKNYYMVWGTDYHVDNNLTSEEYVCEKLKQDGYNTRVGVDLTVGVGGEVFHLLHKVGYSADKGNRCGAIAKELARILGEPKTNNQARHVIRGHVHYTRQVGDPSSTGFIVPCWKNRDEYAKKIGGATSEVFVGYGLAKVKNGCVFYEWDGVYMPSNTEHVVIK